jgi:hypothetical protein
MNRRFGNVSAGRGTRVNSAFEPVESHSPAVLRDPNDIVVLVAAMIAFSHFRLLSSVRSLNGKENSELACVASQLRFCHRSTK